MPQKICDAPISVIWLEERSIITRLLHCLRLKLRILDPKSPIWFLASSKILNDEVILISLYMGFSAVAKSSGFSRKSLIICASFP